MWFILTSEVACLYGALRCFRGHLTSFYDIRIEEVRILTILLLICSASEGEMLGFFSITVISLTSSLM